MEVVQAFTGGDREYTDGMVPSGQRSHFLNAVSGWQEFGNRTQKYIDTRIDELKSVHKGPLAETKTALLAIRPRISKAQHEWAQLMTDFRTADFRKLQKFCHQVMLNVDEVCGTNHALNAGSVGPISDFSAPSIDP